MITGPSELPKASFGPSLSGIHLPVWSSWLTASLCFSPPPGSCRKMWFALIVPVSCEFAQHLLNIPRQENTWVRVTCDHLLTWEQVQLHVTFSRWRWRWLFVCKGVGAPLSVERTRMLLVLRINVLAKGYSGISMETLEAMINAFNGIVLLYFIPLFCSSLCLCRCH